jgi:glycosyltransferase involved in cell wall biosynthesis
MLISIIIPTYNRASYLLETVNSILEQTYSKFEIIIVSDGSTDNSKDLITKLNHSSIQFIELDRNYGYPAKARNEGIKVSKGDYIAFCDDDDLWEKDKLEKQINIVNCGYNFVFTNYKFLEESKSFMKSLYLKYILSFLINRISIKISFILLSITNPIVNSSVLVSRILLKNKNFNESKLFRASEDYQLWIQIFDMSTPFYLKQELVKYRLHENNISSDFIANLKRCIIVFDNFAPININQKLLKKFGVFFYSFRIFLKKIF